jgi:hypothetical protein
MTDFLDHLVHRTLGLSPPLRRHVPVVVPGSPIDAEWPGESTSRPPEVGSAPAVAATSSVSRAAAGRAVAGEVVGTGPESPVFPVAGPEFGPTPSAAPAAPDHRAGPDAARPRPGRAVEPERQTASAPQPPASATDAEPERPAPDEPVVGDGDHGALNNPVHADVVTDVTGAAARPAPADVSVAPESREVVVTEQSPVLVKPAPPAGVNAPAAAKEFTTPARTTHLPAPGPVAPNVTVTIGTVVVRPAATTTAAPAPAPARARRAPSRSMSLDDYLSTREGK